MWVKNNRGKPSGNFLYKSTYRGKGPGYRKNAVTGRLKCLYNWLLVLEISSKSKPNRVYKPLHFFCWTLCGYVLISNAFVPYQSQVETIVFLCVFLF